MSSALTPGVRLGRYEIGVRLGAGGMGEVYLAQDTRLERTVALKILPSDVAADRQRMQRFIQEAKAASGLNHPNILTIHEIEQIDSTHFIATEFIDGETLRQCFDARRLKVSEALDISVQLASALAAAHAAGIIHRDIKPDNVMLRVDGIVKVLDFGLAKLTERQTPNTNVDAETATTLVQTRPGLVMGTAAYMSPEQARGLQVDERTDIFSLGAVIYEMIAGQAPFGGATTSDLLVAILEREPPPLTHSAPEAPAELERIVIKALAKDTEERYQTAKDLLTDLKRLKQRLDAVAELERSAGAELHTLTAATAHSTATFTHATAGATAPSQVPASSSAQYVVRQVKEHKAFVLVTAVVLALAIAGIAYYVREPSTGTAIESIAVLPLDNQNHDPEMEYLSDGVTDSIINSLTQLPNLRVIARSSVFRYKGKQADPIAVANELGVHAVLTGRIIQRGDNLNVSVELVDVRDNKQIWGDQYERKVADLLAVQREIAQEITSKLRMKLAGAEQTRVTRNYTENAEAYQLYLRGRFYWNKRTDTGLKKAIEYFNQAIDKDPNYALAYTGLADAYVLLPGYAAGSPQDSYPKAKAAAKKALEIDDTLAEAHASLGNALFLFDWNFPESTREFQRAIELNRNYAAAHHWYSGNLLLMGRFDEAIAEMKRALELDPLSMIINTELGTTYFYARQYDQSLEQLRKTLEMDPSFYYAHYSSGMAYLMKRSLEEALAEYQKARQLNDDPYVLALVGHFYAASGKTDQAFRTLDQLKEISKQRYVPAYGFAIVYAQLGEKDQAFQWLEKSYQNHEGYVTILKIDPFFDSLRSDPRLTDLVRRVGLPQ
jgi:eukaryotic-like serine/threonine-protein kinase